MSWIKYLPFYEHFAGDEDQEEYLINLSSAFDWLLGRTRKPQPVDCLNTALFPFRPNNPYTIEDIIIINEPKDVIRALELDHLYLYLQPMLVVLLILNTIYTTVVTYKYGKPFMHSVVRLVRSAFQQDEKNGETEFEMDFAETVVKINKMRVQELEKEVITKTTELSKSQEFNHQIYNNYFGEMEKNFDKLEEVIFSQTEENKGDYKWGATRRFPQTPQTDGKSDQTTSYCCDIFNETRSNLMSNIKPLNLCC